ncbi:hypothetical protein BDW74DRAFT_109979 [Aspergillus multicolor]|uniref:NADP-dependent oxidoreductase n=1 Tax=Aspergillus multicolor TaxID=41759 RepID=UPI003CCDAA6C
MSNKQIILHERPTDAINPSLESGTFRLRTVARPDHVPADKVLVRVHYLSLDPAMRQWLSASRSYIAPVKIGAVMRGVSMSQVVAVGSNLTSNFQVGDWVSAYTGWQEYAILGAGDVEKIAIPEGGRPTDALSVLGLTGLTAYFGMVEIGQPKVGDTVVVSGAAGATGMVAGQIAKIKGAKRVIGLAGSDDKCEFLVRELGFDVAINYKSSDWRKQLKAATPEYINVYFDNVGGEILDACLARAAPFSRFVMCGAISQYNTSKPKGPASVMNVISQRVTMKGFIVFDFAKQYDAAREELSSWLAQGKLARKDHILTGGLEAAPKGLVDLYAGVNTGKLMVEVAPVSETALRAKL